MASSGSSASILPVHSPEDLNEILCLFNSYALSLGIDLSFQEFHTEIARLPDKYAPPTGALLLARLANLSPIGCVGIRPLPAVGPGVCEMKRLYVHPEGRGLGLGRKLAESAIREAKRLRYTVMLLDTLDTMTSAKALYSSLGFVEVDKYYDTPIEGTAFMRLDLQS